MTIFHFFFLTPLQKRKKLKHFTFRSTFECLQKEDLALTNQVDPTKFQKVTHSINFFLITNSSLAHARVVISQGPEEPLPVAETSAAAPVSAIAARRAAIKAGLYKPEPVLEIEEEEEVLEEQDPEGIEVLSVGDEDEEERIQDQQAMEEDRVMSPISGAATPMEHDTPSQLNLVEDVNLKLKPKM